MRFHEFLIIMTSAIKLFLIDFIGYVCSNIRSESSNLPRQFYHHQFFRLKTVLKTVNIESGVNFEKKVYIYVKQLNPEHVPSLII